MIVLKELEQPSVHATPQQRRHSHSGCRVNNSLSVEDPMSAGHTLAL
ncbi:MAG: hypothetical protein RIC55_05760 [Pirellulaceae bacterium]